MRHESAAQGLSYVISSLPPDPAAAAIRRLVEPMATGLQRDGVDGGDAKLAQQELDRLTVVVSHARPAMQVGGRLLRCSLCFCCVVAVVVGGADKRLCVCVCVCAFMGVVDVISFGRWTRGCTCLRCLLLVGSVFPPDACAWRSLAALKVLSSV